MWLNKRLSKSKQNVNIDFTGNINGTFNLDGSLGVATNNIIESLQNGKDFSVGCIFNCSNEQGGGIIPIIASWSQYSANGAGWLLALVPISGRFELRAYYAAVGSQAPNLVYNSATLTKNKDIAVILQLKGLTLSLYVDNVMVTSIGLSYGDISGLLPKPLIGLGVGNYYGATNEFGKNMLAGIVPFKGVIKNIILRRTAMY